MDAKACEDAMAAASIFECLEDIKHTRPLLHKYKFGFDQEHGIAFECECYAELTAVLPGYLFVRAS